jgi:hypothetical protein
MSGMELKWKEGAEFVIDANEPMKICRSEFIVHQQAV